MTRIAFMGTPAFAIPALESLAASGYDLIAVYVQPDRPTGRGRQVAPPPVKVAAQRLGLTVLQPDTFKSPQAVDELRALKPDVIVVAAYGKLLPKSVLDIPPRGCVNIHPSLLPLYRGPSPVTSALLNGDSVTGVTIMLLGAGMDDGPILARTTMPIGPSDNGITLTDKLASEGARLLLETLPKWLSGGIEPQPQDNSRATVCKKVQKEDGLIDWSSTAVEIWRRVRAFQPWPGTYTTWKGKMLKVLESSPIEGKADAPGAVVATGPGHAVAVSTGDGLLALTRVQLEGRKPTTASEFILGYRDFIGSRLPS